MIKKIFRSHIWKINFVLLIVLMLSIIGNINAISSVASSNWLGYAVYRDGVVAGANVNDHAALMNSRTKNIYPPVLHAVGYGGTVKWDEWFNFEKNNTYLGIYKPKSATMTSTLQNSFISKARELRGISYNILDQIVYNAGSATYVKPEHISKLRCDGVVEYVYEWYGYRVGGADGKWDITRNLTANYWEHSGFFITPRKQRSGLLQRVTTAYPN